MIWMSVCLLGAAGYAFVMALYRKGWLSLPEWTPPLQPFPLVSVVIAARNESRFIERCLRSVAVCDYPPDRFEILVVDDFSTDDTAAIADAFLSQTRMGGLSLRNRVIRLGEARIKEPGSNAFKKKAIGTGIKQAAGEIIVVTDADCVVPTGWLRLMAGALTQDGIKIATGPVLFFAGGGILRRFQCLDFAGMMAITAAGIHSGWQRMGNGANMAYSRSVFEAVGGFSGNEQWASGDDLFLLQKIEKQYPGSVFFVKNIGAVVYTEAQDSWSGFVGQRLRWATKNAALPEWRVKAALGIAWLHAVAITLNFVLAVWHPGLWYLLTGQLAIKAISDWRLLSPACDYFGHPRWMRSFIPAFFIHTFYLAIIGTAGMLVRRYAWKGRRVR